MEGDAATAETGLPLEPETTIPAPPATGPGLPAEEPAEIVQPPRRPRNADLHRIGRRRLEDERASFVAPPSLEKVRRRLGAPNGGIYLVHGTPGSGRTTVALNLALCLRPEALAECAERDSGAQIEAYFRDPNETRRIRAVLDSAERNRVVIVEDGGQALYGELKSLQSSFLLADRGVDLILVADEEPALNGVTVVSVACELGGAELAALLRKRLAAWAPPEDLDRLLKLEAELISRLGSARRIVRFSTEMRQRWSTGDLEGLARTVVREIAHEERRSESHFYERLTASQRLAALLVGLFEGLDHKTLFRLLDHGSRQLRARGHRQFDALWGLTFEDLAKAIQVREVEGGGVWFAAEMFRLEVTRQLARQGDWFWELVQNLNVTLLEGEPDLPRCQLVGLALARLAEGEPERFWLEIGQRAATRREGDRLVAAIALERFARRGRESREQALFVLGSWLEETKLGGENALQLLSTLVFAAWRFGETAEGFEDRRLCGDLLRQVLQRPARYLAWNISLEDQRWLRAQIVYVLLRSMEARPGATAELLEQWLRARPSGPPRELAWVVLSNLMSIGLQETSLPEESLSTALLELLPAVFSLSPGSLEFRMVKLILHWRETGLDDGTVIRAAEPAITWTRQARLRLLKTLLNWAFNREPGSTDSGGAMDLVRVLSAGLQASLGAPLPGHRPQAVLLVDSDLAAGAGHRRAERLAELARALFGGACRLTERRLGEGVAGPAAGGGQARPRLMLPPLEATGRPELVIVASLDLPRDLDDFAAWSSALPLIVLSPGDAFGWERPGLLRLGTEAIQPLGNLPLFESFFDRLLAIWAALAGRWSPLSLRPALRPGDSWPERILAAAAPAATGRLPPGPLSEWLDGMEIRLRETAGKNLALAESSAQMTMLALAEAPPAELAEDCLDRWALQLVGADWHGTRTLIWALRHWLKLEAWDPLLRLPQSGWRYQRWFSALPPDQLPELRLAVRRWSAQLPDGLREGTGPLAELYRRIELMTQEGARLELPATGAYSLIVYSPEGRRRSVRLDLERLLEQARMLRTCVVHLAGRLAPIATVVDRESRLLAPAEELLRPASRLVLPVLEQHDASRLEKVVLIGGRHDRDREDLGILPVEVRRLEEGHFFSRRGASAA